jgi:hypothetical protein
VGTLYLHQHDPAHGKQQSYNRPRTQDQNPSLPSHIWCGLQQWVCRPSGTDYSEGDITEDQHLTANSDRLSHFGRRMSLFLQTLILGGILFREQESGGRRRRAARWC